MYTIKTAQEALICKQIIANNTARIQGIDRYVTALSKRIRTMSLSELRKTSEELAELRKEIADLNKATRNAQMAIAEFYAPRMVI